MTITEQDLDERIAALWQTVNSYSDKLDDVAGLAAKVAAVLHHRVPTLEDARKACNDAGVQSARAALHDSLDRIERAQAGKRAADEEARIAAEVEADALIDAEWLLDGHFTTEANKTYLTWEGEKRAMTADDRKAWKVRQARTLPSVVEAGAARRAAEQKVAEARHALELAEKFHSVCRADLDGAIAVLATIRLALASGEGR